MNKRKIGIVGYGHLGKTNVNSVLPSVFLFRYRMIIINTANLACPLISISTLLYLNNLENTSNFCTCFYQ